MPRVAALVALAVLAGCGGRETAERGASRRTGPARFAFERAGQRLIVEIEQDDRVHFELAAADGAFAPGRPIFTTPMIAPDKASSGPRTLRRSGRTLITAELSIRVGEDLCVDLQRDGARLARLCPTVGPDGARLAITPPAGAGAYGLGQSCVEPGLTGGDWSGRVRRPASEFGNKMLRFDGGACGDTQFPVLHAIGRRQHLALFVDDVRAHTWDLRREPWSMVTPGRELRWYVMAGDTPLDLRAGYMSLTGRPPVPPRAAFGLWVSEYGYDDWAELEGVLAGLRRHGFPVDGFVLDLQWFGGIREKSPHTSMGKLAFDTSHFPDPAGKLADLRGRGVGIMLIEESFVGGALPEHARLAEQGFLAARESGEPVRLAEPSWWGVGGMIDWSNPAAGDFWHDWKRQPLVALGVVGHWTDLGEPELFDPAARYHGFAGIGRDHAAVHNLYNLAWAESIARGYRRHRVARRPFILSRSGTAGIQRHGAAMWSGDLGSRFTSLAVQQRNQLHMTMSGVDYYGSDVGGFSRDALGAGGDMDELYTRWLIDSAATDVPLRPHTFNLGNTQQTSPDRIGHRPSNLAAVRQRYELVPYLYSLAHRAHRTGEPVFPPLFLHHPDDPAVREIGDQKLIGRDLMVALTAAAGQKQRRVYLPAGTWFDFVSDRSRTSRGEWLERVPLGSGRMLRLPLFARAGALIPLHAPGVTSTSGLRDGERGPLRVRVYPSAEPTAFTLFEDDGETTAYLDGAVRETELRQRTGAGHAQIEIGPARGTYRGAPAARALLLEVVGPERPTAVELDGRPIAQLVDDAAWSRSTEGWRPVGARTLIKARSADVRRGRQVRLLLASPQQRRE
ncbi:MAG TPA: TIM-barrel domain-containing protein [Kofleriaceae bacterium]|nr:TIM-barrel domain-containing protein [Kofleriaceae bacterium]